MSQPQPLADTLHLPSGARFYRCALQVNPFDYLARHKKLLTFQQEDAYNAAIIESCRNNGIEVIAVTDHYQVRTGERLLRTAEQAGIRVFPGFEAVSKDGVHFLCLFSSDKDLSTIDRIIGDCGVHNHSEASPTGKYDATELLLEAREKWNAVCIAAHVAAPAGGLLAKLSGQPRVNAWTSDHLLACSLPGPVSEAPEALRPILENRNVEYRRARPVAILNVQDVSGPDDLSKPGASCWIKMSEVSAEGLRQAFLDPDSRIRLVGLTPPDHAQFEAIAWQGGFLDGAGIHFNDNLNVLIGGRGTGKSTVVESLRYVLGLTPLGEEASRAHAGIVQHVLRNGTKISLLVRSHRPARRKYLIERTIPNPPIVRDERGTVLNLLPSDVVQQVEVYGQHEISELTKSRDKLTHLLGRFVERDLAIIKRKTDLIRDLERSRLRISEVRKELQQIHERLGSLPALEETLKRFQETGLEERLKQQSLLVREERLLAAIPERIKPFREVLEQLRRDLPIDRAFVAAKALQGLPGAEILGEADDVLDQLSRDLDHVATGMAEAISRADSRVSAIVTQWQTRKATVQAEYEKILRELQKTKVDGEEFIRLRRQIEDLRPLRDRLVVLRRDEKEHQEHRRNLRAEWEDVKAEEFRRLEAAAKKVTRKLVDRVRVQVQFAANREPLLQLLREQLGGRLAEACEVLGNRENLSLTEFVETCRAGTAELVRQFRLPQGQADRIAQLPHEVTMQIEELDLPPTTRIELNVAPEGQPPAWQSLDDLSTGQKATAVLLLLLLESEAPLIVDQPEDDLDNRFITDGVVPKMREEKRHRQFVFSTHNANIPVLGDAELILGLSAAGEATHGRGRLPPEYMGAIDSLRVRELVEEVLEGGKDAFEMRRLKYGF
jgi:DNA repair ATPase RecN